jgi:hypothetical protein
MKMNNKDIVYDLSKVEVTCTFFTSSYKRLSYENGSPEVKRAIDRNLRYALLIATLPRDNSSSKLEAELNKRTRRENTRLFNNLREKDIPREVDKGAFNFYYLGDLILRSRFQLK